ncbi:hypothetical protein LguiA_027780 [Lonicera macranthoides]
MAKSISETDESLKAKVKKEGLGWMEWLRGWFCLFYEMLFQRIMASHLHNPMPLPPVNDITCIITGSTSGIGREIARQLAEAGAHVVMAVRNPKAADELIKKWQDEWSGKGLPLNIEVMELDLVSLESVVRFSEAFNARLGPLHALINNAGIFSIGVKLYHRPNATKWIPGLSNESTEITLAVSMIMIPVNPETGGSQKYPWVQPVVSHHLFLKLSISPSNQRVLLSFICGKDYLASLPPSTITLVQARHLISRFSSEPQKFSKDGYEEHMQVNHLAPALLSLLLLPSLVRGSPSRIINVNSIMHSVGFVDTEDMNVVSGKRKYTSLVGYSSSKLAQVMFSSVLHKRLPAEAGISVLCVSPGIVQTNVARDLPKIVQAAYRLIPYFIFNAQEGKSLVMQKVIRELTWPWCVVAVGSRSALFAATDPQIPEYCEMLKADEWPVCAYISQDCRPTNPSEEAHNVETAFRVWEKTLELIGLPSDTVERLIEGEEVKCRYGDHHG